MTTLSHRVLDVWSDIRMADVLRSVGGTTVKAAGSDTESTALHDAVDLRLVRSGIQLLRSRSDDGDLWDLTVEPSSFWHKDLGAAPVRWIAPAQDHPVPDVVIGALRGAPLVEILVERTVSRAWTVTRSAAVTSAASVPTARRRPTKAATDTVDETGDTPNDTVEVPAPQTAMVVLHDLSVLRSRRVASRRSQVVVEGDGPLVEAIVALLESRGGEPSEAGLATLDVLGARAERPIVPIVLEEDDTMRALVRVALGRSVARLLANDVAVRLDLGPEAVHQARVATRRLRSDLRTLRPVLDDRWANVIDRELRWLAGLFGELRDADVLHERLAGRLAALAESDQFVGQHLIAAVDAAREVAAEALHRAMASHRYARLLDGLVEAADTPQVTRPDADARDAVRELVVVPWAQLRKKARKALSHDSPVADLHEVRIRTKRARYAFDVAGLVIPAAVAHNKRIAAVQDELGELHDAAVAEEWLRDRATRHGLDGAFVIGLLVAAERAEIADRRARWVAAWERADERKAVRWLRD